VSHPPGYVNLQLGGIRWRVLPEFKELLLDTNGLRLQEWQNSGQAQVIKHRSYRTVYHVVLAGASFYLKHYRLSALRARIEQFFRPSKAKKEFLCALRVADRDVATVSPLGWGERYSSPQSGESYLVTRSLDGAQPVSFLVAQTLTAFDRARATHLRQRLAVALGEFVAHLHDSGIVHRDLHADNILARLDENDRPHLHLIDLHDVRLTGPLSWRTSRDNLVLLNRFFVLRANRADRLRFWRAYFQARTAAEGQEDRGQKTEDRRQRTEDRGQKTEDRRQRTEDRGQKTERRTQTIDTSLPRCLTIHHSPLTAHLAREVEAHTWQSNMRFWRRRDKRYLAFNRQFYRARYGGLSGLAVRDLDPRELQALMKDPDGVFRASGVKLLKDSRSSTVADIELRLNGAATRVIFKRFSVRSWMDPWLALFRKPAAMRSWIFGHGLRDRWLQTARPLAVFFRRRAGLIFEGYLLTEKIDQAVDLHVFLKHLADEGAEGFVPAGTSPAARSTSPSTIDESLETPSPPTRSTQLRQYIDRLAGLARELHRRHISYRDFKAVNILVAQEMVWLIDLVGIAPYRRLSRKRRVHNLARLNASFLRSQHLTRTDKLRFLRVYLQWGIYGRDGWKNWWRQIDEATQVKANRNERTGRPLA
jgi:serine/threonine protein kinase